MYDFTPMTFWKTEMHRERKKCVLFWGIEVRRLLCEVQCKLGGSAKYHSCKVVACKADLWQHTFVNMQQSVPSKPGKEGRGDGSVLKCLWCEHGSRAQISSAGGKVRGCRDI